MRSLYFVAPLLVVLGRPASGAPPCSDLSGPVHAVRGPDGSFHGESELRLASQPFRATVSLDVASSGGHLPVALRLAPAHGHALELAGTAALRPLEEGRWHLSSTLTGPDSRGSAGTASLDAVFDARTGRLDGALHGSLCRGNGGAR